MWHIHHRYTHIIKIRTLTSRDQEVFLPICRKNSSINRTQLANIEEHEHVCHCSHRKMNYRKWASVCRASTSSGCSDRCNGSMCPIGTKIHPLPATVFGWRDIRTRRSTEDGAPSAPRPLPCRPSRRLPIDSRPQVRQSHPFDCRQICNNLKNLILMTTVISKTIFNHALSV